MFKVWKLGRDGEAYLLNEIQNSEKLIDQLKDEWNRLMTEKQNVKSYSNFPFVVFGGKTVKQKLERKLELVKEDIIDMEKYIVMLQNILQKVKDKRIREEKIQSQEQIEVIKKFMDEQRQKTELKKAQMANEWESRTKPQETQQYPAQRMMKEWYEGNFDWKNPDNKFDPRI